MILEVDIVTTPLESSDEKFYVPIAAKSAKVSVSQVYFAKIIRRSVDARSRNIKINLKILLAVDEPNYSYKATEFDYQNVAGKEEIVVIGSGPAGLFAALRLIELGFKPIVLERGKEISKRKKDVAILNREHLLDENSNYCFGEGGAGTFSDGKLYTRSKKRGNIRRILEILHFHGASEDILVDTQAHIGTDKLPGIIQNIRKTILNSGGEIHFETRLVDIVIKDELIKSLITDKGDKIKPQAVVLATGHSARDIYDLFQKKNVLLEFKPFAVGVRVEHPQAMIDEIQYHGAKNDYLPTASYGLVAQVNGRGVYSFCMCPGGIIVPSATSLNEVVVNGMSASKRNSPYANSGIVVETRFEDLKKYHQYGALAGLMFQKEIEQLAFQNGDNGKHAPAQALADFVKGKTSNKLPKCSYNPGVIPSSLHIWLPEQIGKRLQYGFNDFSKKMKGFVTNEAIILGVESRTSSPVRIPRDKEQLNHIQIRNLFPCGEGAGYAGGIVSSALDGENVVEALVRTIKI